MRDVENPMVIDELWNDLDAIDREEERLSIEEAERRRWEAYYEYYEE